MRAMERLACSALVLIMWSGQCICRCPDDAVKEVFGCLETLTQNVQGQKVIAGMDTNIIREYCSGGLFNESVECAEKIFAKCDGHKENAMLTKVANPGQWRKGFQILCGNLELYAKHDSCMSEQNSEIHSCLVLNEKIHNDNMKTPDSKSKMIDNICRYFEGIHICTLDPIQRRCGTEVATLLRVFLTSISPPLCSGGTAFYNNRGPTIDELGAWGILAHVISNIAIYFAITFKW